MSIEEFLEDMANRRSHILEYQKNRGNFSEECIQVIFTSLREHYLFSQDTEEEILNTLVTSFKNLSMQIFDTLQQFMKHYAKTDSFTFQIVPEENWDKEVEVSGIVTDFQKFSESLDQKSVSFEEDVKRFTVERSKVKEAYLSVHKMLKQKAFEYFPKIIDLPSLGLRELDFILFQEAKNYMEIFHTQLEKPGVVK